MAKTLVSMEQSYVSAAFFRHLTKERLQRHQAEQLLADGRPQPLKEQNRKENKTQEKIRQEKKRKWR